MRIEEKSVRKRDGAGGGGGAEVNTEYAQTANALNNRTCCKAHTCREWNVLRGSFPFQTSSIHNYSSTNSASVSRSLANVLITIITFAQ